MVNSLSSMDPILRLRSTSRISWAPSGWFIEHITTQPLTSLHVVACPDDFFAVRLGFANINRLPYSIARVIAAPSTEAGDFANPSGGANWTQLTFANGGGDTDDIIAGSDLPGEVVVAGAQVRKACYEQTVPKMTWTDWAPICSLIPTAGRFHPRILMVRVLIREGNVISQPNGGFGGYFAEKSVNRGFEHGAGAIPVDLVSDPMPLSAEVAEAASFGIARATVACFQFVTKNRGVVGMITGDSHQQGTGTSTQFSNFLLKAIITQGESLIGRTPLGYVSTAWGGARSDQFFPAFLSLLPAIRPSFAVLPGWAYNDGARGEGPSRDDVNAFLARLIMATDACVVSNVLPILLTPFPRNPSNMTKDQITQWNQLRGTILSMRESGAVVVDSSRLLGAVDAEGSLNGTYANGLSDDTAHPNDQGHEILSRNLAPFLATVTRRQSTDWPQFH